jgi:hypothetical protein
VPYSLDEAMGAYGFVYTMANSVPGLKGYLDQAVAEKWTPERLTAAIQSSDWYKQNADTARNLVQLQTTDPSTYNLNLTNAVNLVQLKAQQLGRSIDPATAQWLALRTLTENASWDDQRLTAMVSTFTNIARGDYGAYMGQAAQLADHMSKVAQSYGVPFTDGAIDWYVNSIEQGKDTLDGFDSIMRARAKAQYPQFAAQIDAGQTIRDIADPYIAQYAQTLEVPETEVTLNDPYIKKALSQTAQDGQTQTAMPMWKFERTLKDDPRYDSTKQAKDDAFATLNKIGKDWGFVGASS